MKDIAYLLLATILWGVWGFALKLGISRVHPFTFQWMFSIPYILSFPMWYFIAKKTAGPAFDIQALGWAFLAAICSIAATMLMVFALQSKPASLAVALTSAYPIVTLGLALITHTETLNIKNIIGIGIIIVGVIIMQ